MSKNCENILMRKVILYTEIFTNRWVFDSILLADTKFADDIGRARKLAYELAEKSPTFVRISYIVTTSDYVYKVSKEALYRFCNVMISSGKALNYNQLVEILND